MTTEAPPKTFPLSKAVKIAAKLATTRSPLPASSRLLLEPESAGIRIRATNLNEEISILGAGSLRSACCVPAHLFADMISDIEAPEIEADIRKQTLTIRSNGTTLSFSTYKADDFPPPHQFTDEGQAIPFDAKAYRWAAGVVAMDDSRPILTGVVFNKSTGAMGGTDGYRLRVTGEPWDTHDETVVFPGSLARNLPSRIAHVYVSETHVRFDGDWTLTARLIAGTFPPVASLVPQSVKVSLTLDPRIVLKALRPVLAIAAQGSSIVRFSGDPAGIKLRARAEELGSAEVALLMAASGEFQVALNGLYLRNVLTGASESLEMGWNDMKAQIVFRQTDRIEVIMPMFVPWDEDAKA